VWIFGIDDPFCSFVRQSKNFAAWGVAEPLLKLVLLLKIGEGERKILRPGRLGSV